MVPESERARVRVKESERVCDSLARKEREREGGCERVRESERECVCERERMSLSRTQRESSARVVFEREMQPWAFSRGGHHRDGNAGRFVYGPRVEA